MKVILLARSLERAGMERQLVELAKGLKAAGWTVQVWVFYGGGNLAQELDEATVPWRALGKSSRWDLFTFLWRMIGQVRLERPKVIYSFLVEPNIVATLMKPFLRSGKVVWGVRVSNLDLGHYDAFTRVTFRLSCWMSRFADLIIANSVSGRTHHEANGYAGKRMTVIHNGIDTEKFSPSPQLAARIRTGWGVGDAPIVGVVARLHPMKDHANFLRAAALVKNANARFVCIGKGPTPYLHELLALVRSLNLEGRVIWTGEMLSMAAGFSALDLLCLSSSDGEGFPNVVGEAMSCETPCVVTDVGDASLVVGETGLVVPPKEPSRLAGSIDALLEESTSDLSRRGQRARQRIVENFSSTVMVERTSSAIRSLF